LGWHPHAENIVFATSSWVNRSLIFVQAQNHPEEDHKITNENYTVEPVEGSERRKMMILGNSSAYETGTFCILLCLALVAELILVEIPLDTGTFVHMTTSKVARTVIYQFPQPRCGVET
jgi:hypothetical protein